MNHCSEPKKKAQKLAYRHNVEVRLKASKAKTATNSVIKQNR